MLKIIDPDKMKIGYVVLVATRKFDIEKLQQRAGFEEDAKWTHVSGSLGGYDLIEAAVPRSRVINLQREYVDKGYEIKVMQRRNQEVGKKNKVALWGDTMNNLPYDVLQFSGFLCL